MNMEELMKQLQTPFYRIKEKDLSYDVTLLKESLSQNWGQIPFPGCSPI